MGILKNSFFLFAAITIIGLSSCGEDCVAPSIAENIVGTWDVSLSGGDVTFNADGTYIDDSEALYGLEVNGINYDQRSYSIDGTTLTLTLSPSDIGGESSVEYEVTLNECDEMKMRIDFLIPLTVTLVRK